jgi:quercetin dioxygenase-like cupin family protein
VPSAFDVQAIDGSALALEIRRVAAHSTVELGDPASDTLLYVPAGSGTLSLAGGEHALHPRCAGLVVAGETVTIEADAELELVVTTVGGDVDLHAPMGTREVVTSLADADAQQATGARSFQILFGPRNGSTRATLFAGFIPSGKAPWHYHLYDEIVWVPEGPGRLHLAEGDEPLGAGAAFRLRPRQVHIVENEGPAEMTIIGVFSPAGSPSAAFLTADVAADYRFVG